MTAIINLRGDKQMFTVAQIARQTKQREEVKSQRFLKAFGTELY
jgi:hypothetical protein